MELTLDNIGIVSDSTIKLDGLTVVTGRNNSGKTSVGRTMYSLVSAVENLPQHAFEDKKRYAFRVVSSLQEKIQMVYGLPRDTHSSLYHDGSNGVLLQKADTIDSLLDILKAIEEKLESLPLRETRKERDGLFETISPDAMKDEIRQTFEKLSGVLIQDSGLIEYANTRMNKTLQNEFFHQIQPVKKSQPVRSTITIKDATTKYYDVHIQNNQIENLRAKSYFSPAFDSCIFIDDASILDQLNNRFNINEFVHYAYPPVDGVRMQYASLLDSVICTDHARDLLVKLSNLSHDSGSDGNNLFSDMVKRQDAEKILGLIAKAMPDRVVFGKDFYSVSPYKLDLRNLAAGGKIFAIIQILLEQGYLSKNVLLILDEPETHLHPEWQNILAEVIVLLVKELGVKVVLSSHSPNFILAIDAYILKYKLQGKSHFYQSELQDDDYMVRFACVDNHIDQVYADLSQPFLKMDALKTEMESSKEDVDAS